MANQSWRNSERRENNIGVASISNQHGRRNGDGERKENGKA
jgi:hypothetical protein